MDTRTLDYLASIHGSLADQLPSESYTEDRDATLARLDALAVDHLPDRMLVTYRAYLRERLGNQYQVADLMGLAQPSVGHHVKMISKVLRYFIAMPEAPPLDACVAALSHRMPKRLMIESVWWWCHLRGTQAIARAYGTYQSYIHVTVRDRVERPLRRRAAEGGESGEIAGSLLALWEYRRSHWGRGIPYYMPISGVIAEKV